MAFQPPNSKQELQNRRILEDLNQKKQLMLKQQTLPSGSLNGVISATQNALHTISSSESHPMSSSQRTALQHAHANSVGHFITQDSSFGNLILPVLPRIDK